MAEQLKSQLKERSGMFQCSDLTKVKINNKPEAEHGPQPEEEPHRRDSEAGDEPAASGAELNDDQAGDPSSKTAPSGENATE